MVLRNIIKTGLLTAVIGLTVSAGSIKSGQNTVKAEELYCGVTELEIKAYMDRNGYKTRAIYSTSTCDAIVDTQYEIHTRVLIDGGKIVGFEDLQ